MPPKRKRNDRGSADGSDGRSAPYRPQNTSMGQQHDRGQDLRDNGRRSSRGGQGGTGGRGRRNDDRNNPNKLTISGTGRGTPTPTQGPMSPPPRPSSATQTPTQAATPAAELPSPGSKNEAAPYYYEIITDEQLLTWDSTGRQEVIDKAIQSRDDEDEIQVALVFQELTRATLDARLDAAEAGKIVKEVLGPEASPADGSGRSFDPHALFVDTLSMICEAEDGPITPALRTFVSATGVSPMLMRVKFEAKLLEDLGLTRTTYFSRVGIRYATNVLYRQANYNLLREETEGYSKLVTELFTTSGGEPPSSEVVEDTFERVKGLIGTFDLDVGRVLDITLDVFAAVLIKHFRFFIKFLRVSSWWPGSAELDSSRTGGLPIWALPTSSGWMTSEEEEEALKEKRVERDIEFWEHARQVGLEAFFELGGRRVVDEATKQRVLAGRGDGDAELDADKEWIEQTGTFPPAGNHVAAQLLGFKLRFYASGARDKDDVLPANLIYLTALLIKIGFISLRDLYSHLWPLDEDMHAVRDKKLKELAEKEKANRPGGGVNALMLAGALPDDTLPNGGRNRDTATTKSDPVAKPAAEVEDPDKLDEPTDQKVQLLTCLLTIGAIPEALFILGRHPWIPEVFPEVVDLINRLLGHMIKEIYEPSRPVARGGVEVECPTKKAADFDQTGLPKGDVRISHIPVRKQLRWPFPDRYDTNEGLAYRFYWDEWADNVPICHSVDDLFTLCDTLLNLSGVGIGKDTSLLSKLARIGVKSLTEDHSENNLKRWQDLLTRLLVPALSLTKSNSQIANEIFDMLRFYPISVRYTIYAEWFLGATSRLPAIKTAFARAKAETDGTMKRISKTNLSAMARALAKIASSSPGIVFKIALSQIESYDNLIDVVVQCASYFTHLAVDVLVWSLLTSLGGKHRDRNNAEFVLQTSRWLLALSSFSGRVFSIYKTMDPTPILRYVNDQLYADNATDLIILEKLISNMAGIVPATDYNDDQLAAMTGGKVLREQALINLQDRRHESGEAGHRLMKALTDSDLAGELLVSLAQYKQSAIYRISDADAHIKLLATMIDNTQTTLFQYLDLLRSNLSVEEFDRRVPGLPELIRDFGLQPALAFLICRTSLEYAVAKLPLPPKQDKKRKALQQKATTAATSVTSEDVQMQVGDSAVQQSADTNGDLATSRNSVSVGEDTQMDDVKVEAIPTSLTGLLKPITSSVESTFPKGTFEGLTAEFYVVFWTLAMGDLHVPSSAYTTEGRRLNERLQACITDRSDMSRRGIAEREEKKKVLKSAQAALISECNKLVDTLEQKRERLLQDSQHWFSTSMKGDELSDVILEKCLIPRLLISPLDADYCFKIIRFLHDSGVPRFRTLSLYGRLFKTNRLRTLMFTSTMREAENLGRFLRLVLSDLARWHSDSKIYEKEAWGPKNRTPRLPGFAKSVDANHNVKAHLEYEGNLGFRNVLFGWHKTLNAALRDCLDSREWMHIRNAITVLKSLTDVFPAVDFMGNNFIKQLETITTREKDVREDLCLTANAVLVQLKKRSKKWVMVQAFCTPSVTHTNGSPEARANQSSLKPTAAEFKPQSRASSLGVPTPKSSSHHDVEDGEVDDSKVSKSASTEAKKPTDSAKKPPEDKPVAKPDPVATMETKRSEILDRREQIKRQNAAMASASSSEIPPRPINISSSISDRTPNLPSRPDVSIPNSRELLRDQHPPRHLDRRDLRDPRNHDPRAMDRSGNRPSERRDFSGNDRRPDFNSRDFGRPDRTGINDRDRPRPEPPAQWRADSARDNHSRDTNGSRVPDIPRPPVRNDMLPPPRIPTSSSERDPPIPAERLPLAPPARPDYTNQARQALISGDKDTSRSDSPRHGRDGGREDVRDRTSSRPQSPRRHLPEKDQEPRREDRLNRNGMLDTYNPRGKIEEGPPAGPRSERPPERTTDRPPFLAPQPSARPPPIDQDNRRPPGGFSSRQQDPNYGRLGNPTPDIPSGPRDSRTSRIRPSVGNVSAPLQSREPPRPPTPDKQPPTGPSSHHLSRHAPPNQMSTNPPSVSAPTTPLDEKVHPSRRSYVSNLNDDLNPAAQNTPPNPFNPTPPGFQPNRLRKFDNSPYMPPNLNHMNNNRRPGLPPLATAGGPPIGPKGVQSSPANSGSNGFTAPTGPSSATERVRPPRGAIGEINSMLQQAGTPDRSNFRGRGRFSSGFGPQTPTSGPSTPIVPPPPPPGLPPYNNSRNEPIRDVTREPIAPNPVVDLIPSNATPTEDRDRERSSRRSGRHSRRASRSPGRERESKRTGGEEERGSRSDYRDRRDAERERHQANNPNNKELITPRDSGSGRERERASERDRDSRREGRDRETTRESHAAGWNGERGGSGRSKDLRRDAAGEERRDSRGSGSGSRDEGGGSGRKRRNEEGGMQDSRGHDKRLRTGR